MTFINYYNSPLGKITLAARGTELSGLWFEGQKNFGSAISGEIAEKSLPVFEMTKDWLDIYFGGRCPDFTPPVLAAATPFRKLVYDTLLTIPYGKTMSYGEIAARVAEKTGVEKMSAQAVGAAAGRNPVSIIIPCHRVVAANGRLTGYAGGLDKKLWLLKHEKAEIAFKDIKYV